MGTIVLNNVRLSFPDLFKVGTVPPGSVGEPKFGGTFIFDKDSEAFTRAQAEVIKVANTKWGKNGIAVIAELPKDKLCLRKGDSNLDKQGDIRNGFAGKMYLRATNKVRPIVVDRDKTPLIEADGRPYGGCYVNVSVDIYPMDKLGKGIYATLLAVQFVSDGESFGGATATADVFDAIDDGESKPAAIDVSSLF